MTTYGWRWYPAQPVGDELAYRFRHQAETKAAAEQEIAAAVSPTPPTHKEQA